MFYSVLYSEVDMEGDIYEIDASAEKERKSKVITLFIFIYINVDN